jgi:tRNA nucleotidyltransferase (CCA-adding enzyme)
LIFIAMPETSLSALSAEAWPFSLDLLPQPAYLVGGAVRDALLGRQAEYLDLDFVLPVDAVKTARSLANHYQAGFVLLDADRQIARVVFPQGTVDFAQQEGSSIETDLQRRDFTVNAIAYNPFTQELIDPLQGYNDLQQGLLRMVSPANLEDDPLRLLRAYRQAAQLGFVIESNTQSVIRQLAPLLGQVAAERVLTELRYLLKIPSGTAWIIAAVEDGLLSSWFGDHILPSHLATLAAVDSAAETLAAQWSLLEAELTRSLRDTINTTGLGIAKLINLLPSTLPAAEQQLMRLTFSRPEIQTVATTLKYLPQLQQATLAEMSVREQYFFFREVGTVFPILVVLAIASGTSIEALAFLIQRYLNPDDLVAHPKSLVTGNDLMRSLHLPAGRQIGELLVEIQVAQAEGKISTFEAAIQWAAQRLDTL